MIVKIKKPKVGAYEYTSADLLFIKRNIFYHCREEFHYDYEEFQGGLIGFRGNITQAKKLLNTIENKLKIPLKKRASFFQTNLAGWFAVNPKWWKEDQVRIQLFTILLRARCSSLKQLYANEYIDCTREAFDLFLDGNFDGDGYCDGWVTEFSETPLKLYNKKIKNKNKDKIKKIAKIIKELYYDGDSEMIAYHILQAIK